MNSYWLAIPTFTAFFLLLLPAPASCGSPALYWLVNDDSKPFKVEIPKGGLISDQKSFDKIFTAAGLGEKPPSIDWTQYVVTTTSTYGGHIGVDFRISKEGDADLVAGPRTKAGGNTLVIAIVARAGVKTFRGQSLPKMIPVIEPPFFDPTDKTELVDPEGPSQIRVPKTKPSKERAP